MDEQTQHEPGRRAVAPDSDLLVPRPEIGNVPGGQHVSPRTAGPEHSRFAFPSSAIGPLFRYRFERIYRCRVDYKLEINNRATTRVLGGYYKTRRLVRIYSKDRELGPRPLEELFDTFLHEMAHHLEYTEPLSFAARACGRVPGRMHSRLFWKILGELKYRWARLQRQPSHGTGTSQMT
jgi:hypothetical protein